MFKSTNSAQGTIEYLVIIAVVVVISLIVVNLLVTQSNNSQIVSKSSNKLGGLTQSIGVTDALVSSADGNFVLKLLNNTGNNIIISNVKVGDININYAEQLAQGASKFFKVSSGNSCVESSVVNKSVVITYTTLEGLSKSFILPSNIIFDCSSFNINQTNLATPSVPVILTVTIGDTSDDGSTFTNNYDWGYPQWVVTKVWAYKTAPNGTKVYSANSFKKSLSLSIEDYTILTIDLNWTSIIDAEGYVVFYNGQPNDLYADKYYKDVGDILDLHIITNGNSAPSSPLGWTSGEFVPTVQSPYIYSN